MPITVFHPSRATAAPAGSASEALANLAGRLVGQIAVYALMRRLDAPRWAALAFAFATGHLAAAVETRSTPKDPRPTAQSVAQYVVAATARGETGATRPTEEGEHHATLDHLSTGARPRGSVTITVRLDEAHRMLVARGWTIQPIGTDEVAYVRPGGKPWKWAGEGRVGTDYYWQLDEALLDALGLRGGRSDG